MFKATFARAWERGGKREFSVEESSELVSKRALRTAGSQGGAKATTADANVTLEQESPIGLAYGKEKTGQSNDRPVFSCNLAFAMVSIEKKYF